MDAPPRHRGAGRAPRGRAGPGPHPGRLLVPRAGSPGTARCSRISRASYQRMGSDSLHGRSLAAGGSFRPLLRRPPRPWTVLGTVLRGLSGGRPAGRSGRLSSELTGGRRAHVGLPAPRPLLPGLAGPARGRHLHSGARSGLVRNRGGRRVWPVRVAGACGRRVGAGREQTSPPAAARPSPAGAPSASWASGGPLVPGDGLGDTRGGAGDAAPPHPRRQPGLQDRRLGSVPGGRPWGGGRAGAPHPPPPAGAHLLPTLARLPGLPSVFEL